MGPTTVSACKRRRCSLAGANAASNSSSVADSAVSTTADTRSSSAETATATAAAADRSSSKAVASAFWPPSQSIDLDDEEAVYKWAIEASMEDARQRRNAASLLITSTTFADQAVTEEGIHLLQADTAGLSSSAHTEEFMQDAVHVNAGTRGAQVCRDGSSTGRYELHGHPAKRRCFDDLKLDKQRFKAEATSTDFVFEGSRSGISPVQSSQSWKRPADDFKLDAKRLRSKECDNAEVSLTRHEAAFCGGSCAHECFYCWLKSDGSDTPTIGATDAPT